MIFRNETIRAVTVLPDENNKVNFSFPHDENIEIAALLSNETSSTLIGLPSEIKPICLSNTLQVIQIQDSLNEVNKGQITVTPRYRVIKPKRSTVHISSAFSPTSKPASSAAKDETKRPAKCYQCGRTFKNFSVRNAHLNNVHLKIKRYSCDLCGVKFYNNSRLRSHIKIVHEKVKDYKCDQCRKNFSFKYQLVQHINVVHENKRDFQCMECHQYLKTHQVLKRHTDTFHKNLRTHKCPLCDKDFGRVDGLNIHIRIVHEKKRDFICPKCGKAFTAKAVVKNHLRSRNCLSSTLEKEWPMTISRNSSTHSIDLDE